MATHTPPGAVVVVNSVRWSPLEALNLVRRHYLEEGHGPGWKVTECVYLSEEGDPCAIGLLMLKSGLPKDHPAFKFEGSVAKGFSSQKGGSILSESFPKLFEGSNEEGMEFLRFLQRAHDEWAEELALDQSDAAQEQVHRAFDAALTKLREPFTTE